MRIPLILSSALALAASAAGQPQFAESRLRQLPDDRLAGTSVRAGDLDGDGDEDLAFAHTWGGLRIYLNQAGVFVAGPWQGGANTDSGDFELADVDGDTDLDLVISLTTGISVLRNDGSAVFTADPEFATPNGFLVEDVDSDNDPDVIVRFNAVLYTNDGTGAFTRVGPLGSYAAVSGVAGDFNGDGDRDLIFSDNRGDWLHLRTGPGTFAWSAIALPSTVRSSWMAVGYVDGNTTLDLVAEKAGETYVFLNDGTGQFTDVSAQYVPAQVAITNLILRDLTGDGLDELIGADSGSMVLLHNLGGSFGPRIAFSEPARYGVGAFVDALGNGSPWLAVANAFGDGHRLFDFSTGAFVDLTDTPGAPLLQQGVMGPKVFADVDDDGLEDLLATAGWLASHSIWLQRPTGFLPDPDIAIPATSWGVRIREAADLNLDGHMDFLVSGSSGSPQLYINDGNGNFVDETAARLGTVPGFRAYTCHLDQDGDLDLVCEGSGVSTAYFNVGGQFVNPTVMPFGALWAFADLNGDGADDVLSNAPRQVFMNDGTGQFSPGWVPPLGYNDPVLADLDGDTDVDFITGARMFINDGTGSFTDETAARIPEITNGYGDPTIFDVDADGDPDVVAQESATGARAWFENDGAGSFTLAAGHVYQPPQPWVTAIAGADTDGDGDQDLAVLGGEPVVAIHRNRHRQLEVPLNPRLGGTLDVDVHMVDGSTSVNRFALLYVDAALGTPITLVPFGTWHMRLPGAVQVGAIQVSGHLGTASYPLPVSASALITDLYLQALMLPDADPFTWRFSNVVRRSLMR